ncbi:acetate--CoA ligase [Patescibacteria group bacterium]|nr:acetate--CoA ligase [Patescibacteria group bacterium]MBU1877079.1 acetate--CoA ligase [Patescibacteria group bacterium]
MRKKAKVVKKGELYFPNQEFKKRALIKDKAVYRKAAKNPVKFWEDLAKEVNWYKKWKKGFVHKPPYFQWFVGGKINITETALERNLKTRRNKLALIWEPEPVTERARYFTYYDLFREVNRFANALKKLGVKKGDRVGVYLPMVPEAIISMLACARIGAVHVVVFSAFSSKALQIRLQDTKAKVLITADGYYRRGEVIHLKQNADKGLKDTDVKKVVVVKRVDNEAKMRKGRDLWWHDLVKNESDWCESAVMDSEDLLFILYTSGSTGKPKGCCHVCGGYTVQANFTAKWIFDLKEDDIFWSTADVGWITGHTYGCYGPLLCGSTFIIFEGAPDWPTPDRWCDIIEKYGVTTFYTAPTAIRMFEKYGIDLIRRHKLETLQVLGSVGEPIDEAAWKMFFKEVGKERCLLVDTWWQTETGGILITSLPGVGPFKPTFAGLPFPGVKADILDEKGRSLPANKEGNLVILPPFTPGLLRTVYKNPKKFLKTYWADYGKKIYFTNDSALKDKNGLIRIVGRVDDVIKVAGHRLTTGELESAIALHKDIIECAVVGRAHDIKGEVPVAFVVSKKKKPVKKLEKEVIGLVRQEIGPIASPSKVYFVRDLPKTRSGKIMRRILRKLFTGEGLGDLSTLANPESVDNVRKIIQKSK